MKSSFIVLALFLLPSLFYAEEYFETRTEHFYIRSTSSSEDSAQIGYNLEAIYGEYSRFLQLQIELRNLEVYHMATKEEWTEYLSSHWSSPSNGNFYLREQGNTQGSTLYLYGNLVDQDSQKSLRHLIMIQILNQLSPHCPSWLKLGLATYFEESPLTQEINQSLYYRYLISLPQDYPWMNMKDLHSINQEALSEDPRRKAELWLLFTYYLNHSQPDQSRILWNNISSISSDNYQVLNITEEDEQAFFEYRNEIQGLEQILETWRNLYMDQNFDLLEEEINQNRDIFPGPAAYFSGLMEFRRENWQQAIDWFSLALQEEVAVQECIEAQIFCFWELGDKESCLSLIAELPEEQKSSLPEPIRSSLGL